LGEGVSFKAKLIGILEVSEARGDRMCQEALADLKMAIRAAGEHKQRITINIAIDGLRLRDEKTGVSAQSVLDSELWLVDRCKLQKRGTTHISLQPYRGRINAFGVGKTDCLPPYHTHSPSMNTNNKLRTYRQCRCTGKSQNASEI
jgi:hypothetical protein